MFLGLYVAIVLFKAIYDVIIYDQCRFLEARGGIHQLTSKSVGVYKAQAHHQEARILESNGSKPTRIIKN